MTITTYYYTFGFLVKIGDCVQLLGYTELTPEKKSELDDELGFDEDAKDETILQWWFEYDMREAGGKYPFAIGKKNYIIRSFKHDHDDHDKYYVVGLDIGNMDRFEGIMNQTFDEDLKDEIVVLAQDPAWIKIIQKVKNQTGLYKRENYTVPNPEYEKFSIAPSVYTTTEDCDCCS